jgi:hypothetical protein
VHKWLPSAFVKYLVVSRIEERLENDKMSTSLSTGLEWSFSHPTLEHQGQHKVWIVPIEFK